MIRAVIDANVFVNRISQIISGKRSITTDLYRQASAIFWMLSPVRLAGIILCSISAQIFRFITLRSNSVCRFSQNWASIPKYRSSLNAVSAVIALLPFTISLILLGGTERSLESRFMLIPRGSKKSSRRISPGFIGSRLLCLFIIGTPQ